MNDSPETVLILNPKSGSGDHTKIIQNRVELLGYTLKQTTAPKDAIMLSEEAAESGASVIVAAGGDGTVNEVIQGIDRANAFNEVTLGIVPLGTGNNFAKNIGVTDLDTAFSILEDGERKHVDLGYANDRLFVNSCVAGLTAESSSETSSEMKKRLGVLAYVVTTLRSVSDFEALRLSVEIDEGGTQKIAWAGEAICVLIGNGRRFTHSGSRQANMEDGLLDVTVIEDVSTFDLMSEAFIEQLLGRDASHIIRMQTPALTITVHHPESIRFSLDGEIIQQQQVNFGIRPKALRLAVGDGYDSNPD